MSSAFDSGLRRVSVHGGGATIDLTLPAAVPVDTLIPSIVDILGHPPDAGARYHLARPGETALDPSTTLEHNEIHDGTTLVLSQSITPPPAPRFDDAAEAVADILATEGRTDHTPPRVGAPAAIAVGIVSAAASGLLAVPDASTASRALLAAMAAAVAAALALRLAGRGTIPLASVCGFATVIAVGALAVEITGAPMRVIGSVTALVSVVLLGAAGKFAIVLARLSPSPTHGPDAALSVKAFHATEWVLILTCTLSSTAAAGAVLTVLTAARAGPARWASIAFGGVIAALLLLRTRSVDGRTTLVYLSTGLATATTTLVFAAMGVGQHGPWLAAAMAVLAAAFIYAGCLAPRMSLPPLARQGMDLLECLTLAALAPLTFWVCGTFGAVRGLDLP